MGMLLMGLILFKFENKKVIFPFAFLLVVLLAIGWVQFVIKIDPLSWALAFMWESTTRLWLVFYWLFFGGILFLMLILIPTDKKVIVRKYFHLIISLMFTLPIFFAEENLTIIAFAVTFCILLALELGRISQIPYVSLHLDSFINSYKDQKDTGIIVTSHFYLLFGFSLPLIFYKSLKYDHLSTSLLPFSGLLSIGVADSFSSIFGSYLGKHKWSKTNPKSIEGTFYGFIFLYMANCFIILAFSCLDTWFSFSKFILLIFSSIMVCLMEAFTDQIDNLFLPFYYFSLLNISLAF